MARITEPAFRKNGRYEVAATVAIRRGLDDTFCAKLAGFLAELIFRWRNGMKSWHPCGMLVADVIFVANNSLSKNPAERS